MFRGRLTAAKLPEIFIVGSAEVVMPTLMRGGRNQWVASLEEANQRSLQNFKIQAATIWQKPSLFHLQWPSLFCWSWRDLLLLQSCSFSRYFPCWCPKWMTNILVEFTKHFKGLLVHQLYNAPSSTHISWRTTHFFSKWKRWWARMGVSVCGGSIHCDILGPLPSVL